MCVCLCVCMCVRVRALVYAENCIYVHGFRSINTLLTVIRCFLTGKHSQRPKLDRYLRKSAKFRLQALFLCSINTHIKSSFPLFLLRIFVPRGVAILARDWLFTNEEQEKFDS